MNFSEGNHCIFCSGHKITVDTAGDGGTKEIIQSFLKQCNQRELPLDPDFSVRASLPECWNRPRRRWCQGYIRHLSAQSGDVLPMVLCVPFTFAVDDVPVWSHLVCKHSTVTSDVIYTFNPGVDSHNAVGQQIIPFSFDLNPSGHHPAIGIEIIPATVDQFPVTFRTSTVSMSIPPFAVTSPESIRRPLWLAE